MAENNFNELVRIAQVDLAGNKPIYFAMKKIKGVSFSFASAVCHVSGVDRNKKTGHLSPSEISTIENIIQNPQKHNIPEWLYNRRRDYETGEDKHLNGGDIKFNVQNDIRRLSKIKSYKGYRHQLGLPVRGQRTRGNFRTGTSLGVSRKKVAQAAPAASTKAAAKPAAKPKK